MNDKEQGKTIGFHAGAALDLLKDNFPQIEKIVRVLIFEHTVKLEDKDPFNAHIIIADPGLFSIFNWKMENGDGDELLKFPDRIFLSRSEAKRLFNDEDPVGKTFLINNAMQYTVGGIFEDIPELSHLKFDYLVSTESRKTARFLTDFYYKAAIFYLELKDKNLKAETETAITVYITKYFKVSSDLYSFRLQNLAEIYLNSTDIQQHPFIKSGNYQLVLFMPWIALLILAIVIGNFMILDIGNNISNIFRIGMFKAFGEKKKVQFLKFYTQNLIYFVSAALITLLAIYYLEGKLLNLSFINLTVGNIFSFRNIAILILIVFLIPLIPAFYSLKLANSFSIPDALRYKSSRVVELKVAGSSYSMNLRRLMIGFQLFTSMCLLVASIVAGKQISHLSNMNLGFNRHNILVLENDKKGQKKPYQRYDLLLEMLKKSLLIEGFASSSNMPLNWISNITQVRQTDQPEEKEIQIGYVGVDFNFFNAIGAKVIQGRTFDESIASDSISNVVINNTLAKTLGGEIVGKNLVGFWEEKEKTVIGVVDDIYFGNPNKLPEPMAFVVNELGSAEYLYIRYREEAFPEVFEEVQNNWKRIDSSVPFSHYNFDDFFRTTFRKESAIKSILLISSLISILLSVVGIISVSYLISTSRIKEMGIRRVLGASFGQLFGIYIKEFLIPLAVAVMLAFPLSYIALNDWLTKYANRVVIRVDSFLYAIIFISAILLIVNMVSTLNVTRKNLVDKLRYE
jgi:putative ABC transport system permease protein